MTKTGVKNEKKLGEKIKKPSRVLSPSVDFIQAWSESCEPRKALFCFFFGQKL